jgi:hypothetical protein
MNQPHTYPVWLWGHSLFTISLPVPVLYRTKWLLWRPHRQGPTLHSKCGINKGLIKKGSTIDLQRSRCKGWFLWPAPYTYIRTRPPLSKSLPIHRLYWQSLEVNDRKWNCVKWSYLAIKFYLYVELLISFWLSKGILFRQDNAAPHKAAITHQKLADLHFEVLKHPADLLNWFGPFGLPPLS